MLKQLFIGKRNEINFGFRAIFQAFWEIILEIGLLVGGLESHDII